MGPMAAWTIERTDNRKVKTDRNGVHCSPRSIVATAKATYEAQEGN